MPCRVNSGQSAAVQGTEVTEVQAHCSKLDVSEQIESRCTVSFSLPVTREASIG